jgi:uncharacterized protein (DUF58 family)
VPTREGTVTGVLAVAVFLLATNLASGLMFVLDALLVSLLAVGAVTAVAPLRAVVARRVAPQRVTEGAAVPIEVIVTTRNGAKPRTAAQPGRGAVGRGVGARLWSVEDGWEGARGRGVASASHDADSAACVVNVDALRRGRAQFGPIVVGSRGPLGLIAARRRFAVPGEIVIWPRVHPLSGAVAARFAQVDEGIDARRTRHAADLYGLREYQRGDALGRIHWPSSIRRGAPVVREFEQPVASGPTIVIDLDRRQRPARLDSAVRAAAALLHHLLVVQRRPVTLAGSSEALVELRAWEPAMDWLATVTPSGPPVSAVLAGLPPHARDVIVVASTGALEPPPGCVVVFPFDDLAGTAPLRGHLTYDSDGRVSAW